MQRIAFGASLLLAIVIIGCTGPQPASRDDGVVAPRPMPVPPAATRMPTPPPVASGEARTQQPAPPPIHTRADWTPSGGIHKNQWKVIVVHHSDSAKATPQSMDRYHRQQRHWENGLGYHFVIGNGVNYPDGAVFVGDRWRRQIPGAHCASNDGRYFGVWRPDGFFNEQGVGICLIGDFQVSQPTAKQLASLKELLRFLTRQCNIRPEHIYGHGEVTHKTACPGERLNMAAIRRTMAQVTASSND